MVSDVMCSYCLRMRGETGPLVQSPLAAICRSCAVNAVTMFDEAARMGEDDVPAGTPPWTRLDDETLLRRIGEVATAGDQVETHLVAWVDAARQRGISWARIGESLGMTRQSAWERFAPRL